MSRLKMTQQEKEAKARAEEATSDMSDEDRKREVEEKAETVAKDVAKSTKKQAAKKQAKDLSKGSTLRRTPAKEAIAKPERNDPLESVTIDPDENYPKILHLVVSVGADDERTMEEFIEDVKDAAVSQANAKLVTVLLDKYAIQGKHILSHHYDAEIARLRGDDDDE